MRIFALILFLVYTTIANATEYYVRNGGNDSNSGLSDTQAWANHPWMTTWSGGVTLKAGDVVYMKRGSVWSVSSLATNFITVAQSGTSNLYITTASYGSGDRPLLRITVSTSYDVIWASGKSFLKFDGLHIQHHTSSYTGSASCGIYLDGSSSPCHDIIITNCEIDNIPYSAIHLYVSGYNITVGDINASGIATTTSYSNHIHHYGYGGVILLGCNPTTGDSNFNIYYNYIHDGTRTPVGANVYSISLGVNSTSPGWPRYAYIRYNNIQNNPSWEAVGTHGGSYIYFQDNYLYNVYAGISVMGDTRSVSPIVANHQYVERNVVENPIARATEAGSFIRQAVIGAEGGFRATDVYIRDNVCFYSTIPSSSSKFGIRAGQVDGIVVSGNKIYNGSSGSPAIYFDDGNGDGNGDILITNNKVNDWNTGINIQANYVYGVISIINNSLCCISGVTLSGSFPSSAEVDIRNNECVVNVEPKYVGDNNKIIKFNNQIIVK